MATTSVVDLERRRGGRYEPVSGRRGGLGGLLATDAKLAPAIARLVLGAVMFPHAAQKMFGWFGGHGFGATVTGFTSMGIPYALAVIAILVEFLASIGLILGALSRVAALGIMSVMIGAIVTVHAKVGFFMNWMGTKKGEGFEYHLLAIALALVVFFAGGGAGSVDRLLTRKRAEP